MEILIGSRKIGAKYPTYFIADIAANHDGDLERAIKLIHSAKEAGESAFAIPENGSHRYPGRWYIP